MRPMGCSLALLWACQLAAAFDFSPGSFYGTGMYNYSERQLITQYSATGVLSSLLYLPRDIGDSVRGTAFGADGLLYTVVQRGLSFAVVALDESGVVHQTYTYGGKDYIGGNTNYGKIEFGKLNNFYVTGPAGIVSFTIGQSDSGVVISNVHGYKDIEVLPSGNLLALNSDSIAELTGSGVLVREIPISEVRLWACNATEYDPVSDTFYVDMGGSGSVSSQVMRFDFSTGQLLKRVLFFEPAGMLLTRDGRLVVGSHNPQQTPAFFTTDLVRQDFFTGDRHPVFLSQYVPEPSTAAFAVCGLVTLCRRRTPR